ncbi:hypothetical protein [Bacillus sp. RO1]|uniref:hypothetical protein n=1 Tax=Bacillus sp. RO1 TaxID=2722703 RepID=UPI001456C73B|nr:hypothetical protein [Bacillus sp. RO1]NLP50244.1 hypothetical protein [Bacillus sp. RO1]
MKKAVITTKKPEEWELLKREVQPMLTIDITNFVPVYLMLKDFELDHDPDFKPWGIISSWWQYKKLPVILITDRNELQNVDKTSRLILESSCIFI